MKFKIISPDMPPTTPSFDQIIRDNYLSILSPLHLAADVHGTARPVTARRLSAYQLFLNA